MRSLLKISIIGTAVTLVIFYHGDIEQRLFDLWDATSPSAAPSQIGQSVRSAGAAAKGLMDRVGNALGR